MIRLVSSLLSVVVILFVLVLSLYFCCLIILTTKFLNIVVQEIFVLLYRYRKTYGSSVLVGRADLVQHMRQLKLPEEEQSVVRT